MEHVQTELIDRSMGQHLNWPATGHSADRIPVILRATAIKQDYRGRLGIYRFL